jgi:hypothetical protein
MVRGFGLVLALLLTGCTLALPQAKAPVKANPITGDAVEVTTLTAPPGVGQAVAGKPSEGGPGKGDTETGDPAKPLPAAPEPEVVEKPPLSPEELACIKKGGTWSGAGASGAKTCVKLTRDGGKSCKREKDCEGYCLAKSKTCAPVTPMFGCNEIVQDNGMMVTLCID